MTTPNVSTRDVLPALLLVALSFAGVTLLALVGGVAALAAAPAVFYALARLVSALAGRAGDERPASGETTATFDAAPSIEPPSTVHD